MCIGGPSGQRELVVAFSSGSGGLASGTGLLLHLEYGNGVTQLHDIIDEDLDPVGSGFLEGEVLDAHDGGG
jgi:hypothetical protein